MPPALENAWHARGYYGSVNHNVKAIYQRYMGWFNGNPATLWRHPPVAAATRYLDFMGVADAVVAKARQYYDDGDLRWVAEVLNHVVFAEPDRAAARELLADPYEGLGFGCENGTWRNFHLSGAHELRHGGFGTPITAASADVVNSLTVDMLLSALAVRVDGPRAWDRTLSIDLALTDDEVTHRVNLRNGVLTHSTSARPDAADLRVELTRTALTALLAGGGAPSPEGMVVGGVKVTVDMSVLGRLMEVLDPGDPDFAIVTPD